MRLINEDLELLFDLYDRKIIHTKVSLKICQRVFNEVSMEVRELIGKQINAHEV